MPRKSRRRSTPTKKSCSRQRNKSRSRPRKSRSVAERKKSRSRSRRHLRGGLLSPHQQQEQTAARGKRVSPGDWVAGTAAVLGTGAGLYALQQRRHALQAEQARKTALSAKEEAEKAQKEAERARDEAQNAKKNAENARDKAQTAKEEAVKLKSFANLISTAALSRTEKGSNKATEEARIATEKARIATARADAADQRATEAARDAILAKSKATEAQQTEVAARQRLTETQQTLAETQESLTAAEHKLSETGWTSSDTEVKLDQAEQELAKTKLLVQRLRAQNQRLAAKVSEEHDNYTKTIQGMSLQKLSVLRNIVLKQIQAFLKTENIQQPETPSILGTGLTALGAQTSSILGTGLTALGGTFGSFFTGTTETSMNINEHEFPTTVLSQDAFDSFLLQKKRFIEKITQLITQLKQGKKYLRYDILAYACKLNAIDVNLLKRECENTNDDIKQRFIESIKRIMDYNIPNDTFFTPLLVAFDENYSTENLSRKLNIERPLV